MEYWKIAAASVMGAYHIDKNIPCQDAHRYEVLENDTIIIAVADGAGSVENSEQGAGIAVEWACAYLQPQLLTSTPDNELDWAILLNGALDHARTQVIQYANKAGLPVHTFSTTLNLTILTPDWFAGAQIGDGCTVVLKEDNTLEVVLSPQEGEHASETYFLTSGETRHAATTQVIQSAFKAAAVMTDGLIRLALQYPDQTPFPPFFNPVMAFPLHIAEPNKAQTSLCDFLNSDRVNARTSDDKTLVIAAAKGGE